MLTLVKTPAQKLEKYKDFTSLNLFKEIQELSRNLKGLKIFHVNSTPNGGGVAEVLKSLVPLMRGAGVDARWFTIPSCDNFFETTKEMHNALQGKECGFSFSDRKRYMLHMVKTAELMKDMKPDIWVIHDPQPAGAAMFLPGFRPAISHIHIDLTSSNLEVWKFISGFLGYYDKVILSSGEFIKKETKEKAVVFQPAIDFLNPKNQPLSLKTANDILRNFGLNPDKPIVSQISRFDPWKDPMGVIKAYKLAKKEIRDLQLAFVGLFLAKDDPEAESVYREAKKRTEKDPDIFLFADVKRLGSLKVHDFVNAFQTGSDVILQKSIREGFGMSVAEAMWKGKPVIGGNVGGIKLQIKDGQNGFLISSSREAAKRIVQLVKNPELGRKLGREARNTVRENFSMPRLLRDYLKLFREVI